MKVTTFLNKSYSFLTKYGYLPAPEEGKSYLLSEEGVTDAIKLMQRVGGTVEKEKRRNVLTTSSYKAFLYRHKRNRNH